MSISGYIVIFLLCFIPGKDLEFDKANNRLFINDYNLTYSIEKGCQYICQLSTQVIVGLCKKQNTTVRE